MYKNQIFEMGISPAHKGFFILNEVLKAYNPYDYIVQAYRKAKKELSKQGYETSIASIDRNIRTISKKNDPYAINTDFIATCYFKFNENKGG